ncbi:MAG TPA: ferric reductase-like transmembrane domain-containing protein [Thermomicrobiales bacterium]|nr:ferric reductase-like transmembrane domain-containing protein [Thermomicrobiales bacterium]
MTSTAGTQLYWFVGRGSGIVAYLLLTAIVTLGIALSRRWHAPAWPRLVVHELHRWATITFYAFLGVHTLMMLLDPFIGFSVADVTIPFVSGYRTLWLSLGIIAGELALALGASVLVRDRIGYRAWHLLHGLAYPIFLLSLLHALGTGTDTRTPWALALYGGSLALVLAATAWRLAPARALPEPSRALPYRRPAEGDGRA